MSAISCPRCAKTLSPEARYCSRCGQSVRPPPPGVSGRIVVFTFLGLIAIVFTLMWFFMPRPASSPHFPVMPNQAYPAPDGLEPAQPTAPRSPGMW